MSFWATIWVILGGIFGVALLWFSYWEIKAFRNKEEGDTATEQMEAAIAHHRAVRYGLLPAMLTLGVGFGFLLPIHVYTGLW